jgi:hypothetical protein
MFLISITLSILGEFIMYLKKIELFVATAVGTSDAKCYLSAYYTFIYLLFI